MDYLDYTITLEQPYNDGRVDCYPWSFAIDDSDAIDDGYAYTEEAALKEAKSCIRAHYEDDIWRRELSIASDSIVVLHYANGGYSVEFRARGWGCWSDIYLESAVGDADEAIAIAEWIKRVYPSVEVCKMYDFETEVAK